MLIFLFNLNKCPLTSSYLIGPENKIIEYIIVLFHIIKLIYSTKFNDFPTTIQ